LFNCYKSKDWYLTYTLNTCNMSYENFGVPK
jgi:hypothetical protein